MAQERRLDAAAQRVYPVEHCDLRTRHARLAHLPHPGCHCFCLQRRCGVTLRGDAAHFVRVCHGCDTHLPPTCCEHRRGRVEDVLRGAVVGGDLVDRRLGVATPEGQDVAEVGATEPVDGLRRIAHGEHLAGAATECLHEQRLGGAGGYNTNRYLMLVGERVGEEKGLDHPGARPGERFPAPSGPMGEELYLKRHVQLRSLWRRACGEGVDRPVGPR
ncbi:MAG: hypothetical protein M1522_03560, partial [Actinobacteria bacterium]|nr:hypothetical protein [Actinomycetota bacterium]